LGIAALLLVFSVLPLSASMICFLVIETGLKPEAIRENYSSVWEDGLMSVFFDLGHIVSNSPVLRVEKLEEEMLPYEAQKDFLEAARGGADYFILVLLEYRLHSGPIKPQEALIKIFTTEETPGAIANLVYERRFPSSPGASLRDEHVKAQETARIIAAQLKDR
jgi:hypothetical protein